MHTCRNYPQMFSLADDQDKDEFKLEMSGQRFQVSLS